MRGDTGWSSLANRIVCQTSIEKPLLALAERTTMTQAEQTHDLVNRQVTGDRDSSVALVQAQMKIARGVATLGLVAGVAIGLGVPLIVLNFAPSSEWMRWVVVCSAVVVGSGIIIASMTVVIIGYWRTSRCLGQILERIWQP